MKAFVPLFGAAAVLAGCGPVEEARPARAAPPVPVPGQPAGMVASAIQGASAGALIARFGPPQIDLKEGVGRKLQFVGPACVLDAYLYAPTQGREPVVRHVDTRQRNGAPIAAATCMAALTKAPARN